MEAKTSYCEVSFNRPTEDTLLVSLAGNCKIGGVLPSVSEVKKQLESCSRIQRITFNTKDVIGWDSGLLTFLVKISELCSQSQIHVEKESLNENF